MPTAGNNHALLLEQLARVCRSGRAEESARPAAQSSGFAALDAVLPGGGWPMGAVTELMADGAGIGELSLLLPALVQLARGGRYLAWIAPPYLPYAPALAQHGVPLEQLLLVRAPDSREALWAAEQMLRCSSFGAVLAWPAHIADKSVRRLQLAAEAGASLCALYRPVSAALIPSPAALRLRLSAADNGLAVVIHKARGGARRRVHLRCGDS
jgi:hypothetical protein